MGEEREKSQVEVVGHWKPRPIAARALILGTAALPVATSILFALLVQLLVPEPVGAAARAFWWIGLFGLSSVVFFMSERAARRALPMAILLELALVFPGEAPRRLSIAKRAYATRDVGRFLAEARSMATDADPVIPGDSIVTLAAGGNARDRRTRRHSKRVRSIADLIGGELGLKQRDQDRLRWAVMLHDVGKLGARSEISNKQGSTPPIQRDATRRHPFEGATLEAPLAAWLGDWGSAIAEHRERFDGAGYPFGLVGEEISLGGRILAVADAYDAMTSVRSYKGPISQDAARAEIARRAGTQFDPTVVRAFLAIPVRRQPTLSPGTWLGMLPSRFDSFEGTAVYRVGTALLVLGSILGLAAWGASPSHASAAGPSRTSDAPGGPTSTARTEGGPSSTRGTASARELQAATAGRAGSTSSSDRSDRAGGAQSRSRTGRSGQTGTTGEGTGSGAKGGSTPSSVDPKSPSTTSPPGTTPTTGSPPGTTPSTTRTPPTTTKPPPPPTTTTRPPPPPPPPPAAATGLRADAWCKNVVLGPEISLHWTDSRSPSVTSYEILRSSDGVHYAAIAGVSARTTSFTDSGVDGLGITYWYEVVARSPAGSATSSAVSATTPLTCL